MPAAQSKRASELWPWKLWSAIVVTAGLYVAACWMFKPAIEFSPDNARVPQVGPALAQSLLSRALAMLELGVLGAAGLALTLELGQLALHHDELALGVARVREQVGVDQSRRLGLLGGRGHHRCQCVCLRHHTHDPPRSTHRTPCRPHALNRPVTAMTFVLVQRRLHL